MKNEIFPLLHDLISIPSVATDHTAVQKIITFVENYFESFPNLRIIKHEWNGIPSLAIQNFDGLEADILMCGHLDVVPADAADFHPKEHDGKLYARGAGDMKAGNAVMMVLMKEIAFHSLYEKKVCLLLTTDEEIGGENGAKKIAEMGYTGTVMLIPDSGSVHQVVVAEKGVMHLSIEVMGKGCHASRPWLGENAIEKAFALYHEIQRFIQEDALLASSDHRGCSVSLSKIQGGDALNAIPEKAQIGLDLRLTESYSDLPKLLEQIEHIVNEYQGTVLHSKLGDLMYTSPDHPLVVEYLHSCHQILGFYPQVIKEHGASDGRHFSVKGIPVILHRPDCANIHASGEYVEEGAILDIYEIYRHFIFQEY